MGASAEVKVDLACLGAAALAVQWLPRFYTGVSVTLSGNLATLTSEGHSGPQLQAIWHAALANERLFADGALDRTRSLETLTR